MLTDAEHAAYERGWNDAVKRAADWISWSARAQRKDQQLWVAKLIAEVKAMRYRCS
jgi:hypothetical protein